MRVWTCTTKRRVKTHVKVVTLAQQHIETKREGATENASVSHNVLIVIRR